jgi:uncharacterized protein YjiS (DUF1127 family)
MTTNSNFHDAPVWQINRLLMDAQRARAEAMAGVVVALGRGIANLFAPIVRLGKRTASSFEHQREANRIHSELSRMTDRDLADIGLSRGDICAVAEGKYRRQAAPLAALRPVAEAAPVEAELPRAA